MSPSPLPGPPYLDAESEYDLVDDFAPRNFFSVINFVHILHKLTKRKLHRVLLLVQYKSHVRPGRMPVVIRYEIDSRCIS